MLPTPLPALDFQVLLVLLREELYGYAVMKAVVEQSGGHMQPEIGSLYRVLARLLDKGWIEETDAPADDERRHPGRDRKYYRVTLEGRRVAEAEAGRLNDVVALARERALLTEFGA